MNKENEDKLGRHFLRMHSDLSGSVINPIRCDRLLNGCQKRSLEFELDCFQYSRILAQ